MTDCSKTISEAKAARLRKLANPDGVIAALAIDQRKSLRQMIAIAAGRALGQISDAQLAEFKAIVTRVLTQETSAVLLDPEYGLEAVPQRLPGCGLLLAYEMDGYENPRPHRMLALLPEFSARRLRELGADGIKILLSYTPFDDERKNDEKCALIERIGHECEAAGVPFFLEPVGYDPDGLDVKGLEYARRKPEIVLRSMEEFSKDIYKVDILKVEFPVNAAYVEGSAVYGGQSAYSREDALAYHRAADALAKRPYIYLSAGVSSAQFTEQLRLAAESEARYSGVLCGRAHWQGGVSAYAQGGTAELEKWLNGEGLANVRAVNECLRQAWSWEEWFTPETASPARGTFSQAPSLGLS